MKKLSVDEMEKVVGGGGNACSWIISEMGNVVGIAWGAGAAALTGPAGVVVGPLVSVGTSSAFTALANQC